MELFVGSNEKWRNERMKVNIDNEHNDNGWKRTAVKMKNISDKWTPRSVETMY